MARETHPVTGLTPACVLSQVSRGDGVEVRTCGFKSLFTEKLYIKTFFNTNGSKIFETLLRSTTVGLTTVQ